jgi:hypothetical protein
MTAVEVKLLTERVHRLEAAICELADETHRVSSPAQLVARGLPNLASLVVDARSGVLGALENTDQRTTLERR